MVMTSDNEITTFWFRRDLRLVDNAGLYQALKNTANIQCLFIFDSVILDPLEDRDDARVNFIYESVRELDSELRKLGSSLWVMHGSPGDVWQLLLSRHAIKAVYCNHDYEPYARSRDLMLKEIFERKGIPFLAFKDQAVLEKDEVLKEDRTPYTVFSPFKRRWLQIIDEFQLKPYPTEKYWSRLKKIDPVSGGFYRMPFLKDLGFMPSHIPIPSPHNYRDVIANYAVSRDYPGMDATSRISVHLRFGTVSIRRLATEAKETSEVWLNELIWRDFYFYILWHFPHVVKHAFKPEYDRIKWRNDETEFRAWREGRTGYPLVDAGMRQLLHTGFMHNRVRMVTASFLTKDLLVDYRLGEAWFARKLLDYELSSNNGGWQWAAGTGVDAAPFFRIFNPEEQLKKFDAKMDYVRTWVPEVNGPDYLPPIVDHKTARERCLKVYREALNGG